MQIRRISSVKPPCLGTPDLQELECDPPCQSCGCRTAFAERAPDGQRPVYRCCQCGRGRDDLKQFAA